MFTSCDACISLHELQRDFAVPLIFDIFGFAGGPLYCYLIWIFPPRVSIRFLRLCINRYFFEPESPQIFISPRSFRVKRK